MNKAEIRRTLLFPGARRILASVAVLLVAIAANAQNADPNAVFQPHITADGSRIVERHESGSLVINNKLYASVSYTHLTLPTTPYV